MVARPALAKSTRKITPSPADGFIDVTSTETLRMRRAAGAAATVPMSARMHGASRRIHCPCISGGLLQRKQDENVANAAGERLERFADVSSGAMQPDTAHIDRLRDHCGTRKVARYEKVADVHVARARI